MSNIVSIEDLKARVKRGEFLEESEAQALQEHYNIERYAVRPGHDFGALEFNIHGGRLEELALRERNRKMAENDPHKDRNKPMRFGLFVTPPSSPLLANCSMGWLGLPVM